MDSLFILIEHSVFSEWLRSSFVAFPAILVLHAVGMAFLVGAVFAIDLRILGAAPRVPLYTMAKLMPVLWFGLVVNTVSGLLLLTAFPTKALTNPVFFIKLAFIAGALFILRSVVSGYLREPDAPVDSRAKALAVVSLICWAGSIASGRLLAYTYSRLMADFAPLS